MIFWIVLAPLVLPLFGTGFGMHPLWIGVAVPLVVWVLSSGRHHRIP